MKKKINLFLDDDFKRSPNKLSWIELPLVEWTIVRNYKDFVKAVESNDINMVSFDHDLEDTAYQEFHRMNNSDKKINYDNIVEKTGLHCAEFLARYCIEYNIPLPPYYIHTLNPVGAMNIFSVLENARITITNKIG